MDEVRNIFGGRVFAINKKVYDMVILVYSEIGSLQSLIGR